MELAGHRGVVTGGGGGLGEVIVGALAARRMHVVVVEAVVAAAGDDVDALINCAGGWSPTGRHYPDAAPAEWDAVLALNLRRPMRLLQQLQGPLSRSPVGAAVYISSSAGRDTGAYVAPEYAVAKAGLIRLTTSLADWADRFGICVSCVVPGWIGLPRAVAEVATAPAADRPSLIPPEDVAAEVVRLASDSRSGGKVVVVDEPASGERSRSPA